MFSTIQPIIFVLTFRYVFGGSIKLPGDLPYVDFLMPGVFVQTVAFGAMNTGIGLSEAKHAGYRRLVFNYADPPFNNPKLRQAIASAMTRPNGSGAVLACTTTSSARIAEAASSTNPVNPTRSATPNSSAMRRSSSSRSGCSSKASRSRRPGSSAGGSGPRPCRARRRPWRPTGRGRRRGPSPCRARRARLGPLARRTRRS